MEELKQMAKKKEPTNGELMAKEIMAKYKPKTVEDMQNALKDIFGPMFEAMLNGEMDHHLGYEANDHGAKTTENRSLPVVLSHRSGALRRFPCCRGSSRAAYRPSSDPFLQRLSRTA